VLNFSIERERSAARGFFNGSGRNIVVIAADRSSLFIVIVGVARLVFN
jgi:hypothetical protein